MKRPHIVNRKTNHRGLAGWNLWLNNEWVMFKYYSKCSYYDPTSGFHESKPRREYIKQIAIAVVKGWTPHKMGIRWW